MQGLYGTNRRAAISKNEAQARLRSSPQSATFVGGVRHHLQARAGIHRARAADRTTISDFGGKRFLSQRFDGHTRRLDALSARREFIMAKALAHFTIEAAGEGYVLSIEDEDGTQLDLTASPEQLDLIAEAIEEHLESDVEDLDEVKD
jgi:hypothetical protein